jgi:diacylglycerol kinase family enzyme
MKPVYQRPLLILNPVAGTSDPDSVREAFAQACRQYGWQPEVHVTREEDDLNEVVKLGLEKGCDVVLAGGGDGTVSAVASALVGSDVPMAVIPTGTANFLAKQLDLPLKLEDAFEYLMQQPDILHLDAMCIGERHYVLNASVGFSSALIENTSRENKRRFGFLAYIWTAIRVLIGLQPYRFNLVVDGVAHSLRASEVFISGTSLLKEEALFKDVKMRADDGQLELFVVKARTARDYFLLLWDIVRGRVRRSHEMSYYPLRKQVKINTKKPLIVQADGEVIGYTPVKIKVVAQAVPVLVPRVKKEEHL